MEAGGSPADGSSVDEPRALPAQPARSVLSVLPAPPVLRGLPGLPAPVARHAGARRRPPVGAVAVLVAVLVAAGPAGFVGTRLAVTAVARAAGVLPGGQRPAALPADARTMPLGTPEPAPAGKGGFRYLGLEDDGSGRPVRWDPCRPIHYVVRPDGAPPGGEAAVREAVARVERLTGLRFVPDGATDESPSKDRPTMDVGRYGNRWSPVLVAWTEPREYPPMAGYAGLGGPDVVSGDRAGTRRYVSGVVLLNRDHLAEVRTWPDGPDRMAAVVLHEFGHLVGLDHVNDASQLMFKRPTALPGVVGDGDRRGLATLGDGPCFRDF